MSKTQVSCPVSCLQSQDPASKVQVEYPAWQCINECGAYQVQGCNFKCLACNTFDTDSEDEEPDVGICSECGDQFSIEAEHAIGNNWGCGDCFKSAFKPKERAEKKKRAKCEAEDLLACAEASVAPEKRGRRVCCEVCESNDEVHYSGCPRSEPEFNKLGCYCGRLFCRDGVCCYDKAVAKFRLAMCLDVVV